MKRISLILTMFAFVFSTTTNTPQTGRSTVHAADHRTTTRVYVTNSKGDDVTIIDSASLTVVGSIKTGDNPHGLITSPDRRTLYISVEGTDELISVDIATNQVKSRVKVGRAPNE